MSKKTVIIKCINLLLVIGILSGYQIYALQREKVAEQYQKKQEQAQKAWKEQKQKEVSQNVYSDGTYQGTGRGFGGDIVVEITIKNDVVTAAKIVSAAKETPDYLKSASAILEQVVRKEAPDAQWDTVSGATLSSNGIIDALKEAVSKAAK